MSAKQQFLRKLQARYFHSDIPDSKCQADIAEFRLRMEKLQERMGEWLAGTDLKPESAETSLSDLLVESGVFDISAIILRYENRSVRFTPLYLYGHGVTGCVEVSLHVEGKVLPLGRLFMRAGRSTHWTCTRPGTLFRPERAFDEDVFFGMLEGLLL